MRSIYHVQELYGWKENKRSNDISDMVETANSIKTCVCDVNNVQQKCYSVV